MRLNSISVTLNNRATNLLIQLDSGTCDFPLFFDPTSRFFSDFTNLRTDIFLKYSTAVISLILCRKPKRGNSITIFLMSTAKFPFYSNVPDLSVTMPSLHYSSFSDEILPPF